MIFGKSCWFLCDQYHDKDKRKREPTLRDQTGKRDCHNGDIIHSRSEQLIVRGTSYDKVDLDNLVLPSKQTCIFQINQYLVIHVRQVIIFFYFARVLACNFHLLVKPISAHMLITACECI